MNYFSNQEVEAEAESFCLAVDAQVLTKTDKHKNGQTRQITKSGSNGRKRFRNQSRRREGMLGVGQES